MTAPVATAPPIVRTSPPSGSASDANSAAPFAAALDGALHAGGDAAAARRRTDPRGSGDGTHGHGSDRRGGSAAGRSSAAPRAHDTGPSVAQAHAGPPRGGKTSDDDRPTTDDAGAAAAAADPTADATDPSLCAAGMTATTPGFPPLWTFALAPAPPADATTTDRDAVAGVPGAAAAVSPIDPTGGSPVAGTAAAGASAGTFSVAAATALEGATALPTTPGDTRAAPAAPSPATDGTPPEPGAPAATPVDSATTAAPTAAPTAGAAVVTAHSPAVQPSDQPVAPVATTGVAPEVVGPSVPVGPPVVGDLRPPTAGDDAAPVASTDTVTSDSGPVAAVTGGDSAVAVAGARGSAGWSSADTGDNPAHDSATSGADPAGAALPAPVPASAVSPAAATTAGTAAVPRPVATQVAQQVAVLSRGPDGTHSVTVVLHPDSLGPVQVEVTLTRGTVDLTMRGAHEQGRAALVQALPDLRRDLESAGLTCSRLDVDRDTGGSWSAQHQSAQQQAAHQQATGDGRGQTGGHADPRSRPWGRPSELGGGRPAPVSGRSTSPGVDVLV